MEGEKADKHCVDEEWSIENFTCRNNQVHDFQLRCEGVTFPVHKNILSARSPVFKSMLASDMKEASSGCLDMEDLDPHTLGRFLAFLYSSATGEDQLQWEGALKLYYAADKYQVASLKVKCATVLKDKVSLSNVCDILSLADKHQDEMLKLAATDFIAKNYAEFLGSKEYDSFIGKNSLLLCRTLRFVNQRSIMENRLTGHQGPGPAHAQPLPLQQRYRGGPAAVGEYPQAVLRGRQVPGPFPQFRLYYSVEEPGLTLRVKPFVAGRPAPSRNALVNFLCTPTTTEFS